MASSGVRYYHLLRRQMISEGCKCDRSYEDVPSPLDPTTDRTIDTVLLTNEWRNGSSEELNLENGSQSVRYRGSIGNVRLLPISTRLLIYRLCVVVVGKSIPWFVPLVPNTF